MTLYDSLNEQIDLLTRKKERLSRLNGKRSLEQAYIQSYQLSSIPVVKEEWFQIFQLQHSGSKDALEKARISRSLFVDPLATLFPSISRPDEEQLDDSSFSSRQSLDAWCRYLNAIVATCPPNVQVHFDRRGSLVTARIEKLLSKIGGLERKRRESFSSRKRTLSTSNFDDSIEEERRELDALEIKMNKKRDELMEQRRCLEKYLQKVQVYEEKKRIQQVKSVIVERKKALNEVKRRKSRLSMMDSLIHHDRMDETIVAAATKRNPVKADQVTRILNDLTREWNLALNGLSSLKSSGQELESLKTSFHQFLIRVQDKDPLFSELACDDGHKFARAMLYPFTTGSASSTEAAFKSEISRIYGNEESSVASHIFYVFMLRKLIHVDRVKGVVTFLFY